MKISAKEADETQYWLLICSASNNYPNCDILIEKLEVISKMLSSIITSTKKSIQ